MNVKLLAHTQLSKGFITLLTSIEREIGGPLAPTETTHGQTVALTAIRTCYSPNKPSEIVEKEGARYFGKQASDGKGGTDVDRLIRMIVSSGHTSTLEHLTFTFAIEGVSRALLAQLTRHRVGFSFSVQSQRYCRFGSGDKSGGFDYVIPETVTENKIVPSNDDEPSEIFEDVMRDAQYAYDRLRKAGVPPEDARSVLPQAAACNLVLTGNLRSLLDFYEKRRKGNGAQAEIVELAERLKNEVIKVEPWTKPFFEKGGEA